MNIQYISDSAGSLTGVFIPINEWNELKERFEGIGNVEDEAVYELNEEQIHQIQIAEQQIVDGKYLTHKAAQKQTEEWLKN